MRNAAAAFKRGIGEIVRRALAPVKEQVRRMADRVRELGRKLCVERLARKKAEAERDRLRRAARTADKKARDAAAERVRLRREIASLKRRLRAEKLARKKAEASSRRLLKLKWRFNRPREDSRGP